MLFDKDARRAPLVPDPIPLCPRVRFLECFSQAFCVDVRIDLRGRDVRMSEHFLDAHDFGAVFEQVRGEAVAQHMWARFALPADFAEQVVDVVSQCS